MTTVTLEDTTTSDGLAPAGYIWPERFQAAVAFFVSDVFVLMRRATGLAYMTVDYSIPAERVDEQWNITSIDATPLYALGIRTDTHLMFGDHQFYFYTNSSGGQCARLPVGLFPQDMFANASSFAGMAFWSSAYHPEPIKCLKFVVQYAIFPGMVGNFTLFGDAARHTPVAQLFSGVPPYTIAGPNGFEVLTFSPLAASDASSLFAVPSFCQEEKK